MNKKMLIIAGVIIIVIASTGLIVKYILDQKYLHQFDYLTEPKISTKPNQNMLVADVKGIPSEVSGQAISKLYKVIYKYKDSNQPPVLRGRWQFNDRDNIATGQYGIPIKSGIEIDHDGVRSEMWEYGLVAEILHIGSYSNEKPTIDRLIKFISDNGYRIIGDHEEEYIKGPGMFFKGNQNNYRTIILYRVIKQASNGLEN
jgi:effector-binding domain-containing protein